MVGPIQFISEFSSRFFGGIFRQAISLVPRSWYGYSWNNKTPVLVDTNNLFAVYSACSPLQNVLSKHSEMVSNGTLRMRKKSDRKKEIETHWALDLMKNPNPLQSQREYIYEFVLYQDIYANNFVYTNRPFPTSKPKTITNLPSQLIKIVPTGLWLDQQDIKGIIDHYELYGLGNEWIQNFDTTEVIHTNHGLSMSPLKADSKLISLLLPISNAIAAYKTRNVLITENAGITIISSGAKDAMGSINMPEEERKRVAEQFRDQHGLRDDQLRKVFSSSPITVTPISFPTKDMMLFEEIEDDFGQMCGAFGIDRDIFPSTKGATFENKKQGEISTYQGSVQTTADSMCNFFDKLLLGAEDAEFWMDYSHIPCMQENKKEKAEVRKTDAETYSILYSDGIISKEQFAVLMNVQADGRDQSENKDSLGKIPLALQQLALARERANTANDSTLSASIASAMDKLTQIMIDSVLNTSENGN